MCHAKRSWPRPEISINSSFAFDGDHPTVIKSGNVTVVEAGCAIEIDKKVNAGFSR